jgi:hypothetical protein
MKAEKMTIGTAPHTHEVKQRDEGEYKNADKEATRWFVIQDVVVLRFGQP